MKSLITREVMEMILQDSSLTVLLPQMRWLASIAPTIQGSTADCERGFSLVKIDLRNRLKTKSLDSLLRISVEGPSLDSFDLT